MNRSMPGLPVHHQLPESTQTMSIKSVMPSNSLILCRPLLLLQSFPASGSFPTSQLFASSSQRIGASASVFPMNIQGWFPLGLTGWISLQSKGLSRVFSNTTIRKHQFVVTQPSLWTHSLLYFLQAYQRCHLTLTWVLFSCSVLASKHPSLHPSSVESYEEGAIGLQTISGPLGHSGHCPGHWSVHSDSTSLIVPKISSCCF